MVFFNELFQTVRLSKWYLHFDTPSFFQLNTYGASLIHSKEVSYNVHFQYTVYEETPD